MEKEKYLNLAVTDPDSHLGLQSQMIIQNFAKQFRERFQKLQNSKIPCYEIQKQGDNEQWLQSVSDCLCKKYEEERLLTIEVQQNLKAIKNIKDEFNARKMNCFNLVSESEMDVCYQQELESYFLKIKSLQ